MSDGPEFSHVVKLSELGSKPRTGKLSANADECRGLAERFDLPKITSLNATYTLQNGDERISFTGRIESDLQQLCSVTGESFQVRMRENFDIAVVPKLEIEGTDEEIELSEDDCDIVEYENGQFDIGEAIAQTLYLALDPFPRGPNADALAREVLKTEEEAGPFGALAALKTKKS
ncbi:YceD family protein [Parasphingorhabdus sp.]|uniref:YceD family protein n=1 Tax=Parasphingorhabdus sp. TaxID=2709688 RepID=UPI003001113A